MAKKTSSVSPTPTPFWAGGVTNASPAAASAAAGGGSDWEGALKKLVDQMAGHMTALGNPMLADLKGADPEHWGKENFVAAFVSTKNKTGQKAIKVVVREKTDKVKDDAKIPTHVEHNGNLYPTDVEEGSVHLLQGPPPEMAWSPQLPPFLGGFSIGLQGEDDAGTFGCIVQLDDGRFCLLSNNHVIGKGNLATIDTDLVIAPGALDASMLNLTSTVVGILAKISEIDFTGKINTVDAAVAHIKQDRIAPQFLGPFGTLNPDIITNATEQMVVKKVGRTTGFTVGMIKSTLGVIPNLGYGQGADGKPRFATFREQLVIEGIGMPFSQPGDSGSLVVDAATNKPVGLLFAGLTTESSSLTFANPIQDVKEALGINRFVDAF